jgi:DNA modification methylase
MGLGDDMKLGEFELNQIYTGDARELAKGIPDESVDLIFTDPPYPKEYQHVFGEMADYAQRILRPGGSLMTLCGHYQLPLVINELSRTLDYHWLCKLENTNWARLFGLNVMATFKPMVWFKRGWSSNPIVADGIIPGRADVARFKDYHKWGQHEFWASYYIERLTGEDSIILDPFCGGGTVPAVCKMLHRNYLAFEIDPVTAQLARDRVANTQPPLPLAMPVQESLF